MVRLLCVSLLVFTWVVSSDTCSKSDETCASGSVLLRDNEENDKVEDRNDEKAACLDARAWHDFTAQSPPWKKYLSQGNQDRVLHSLFGPQHLGHTNKFYVEFGFNQDSYEENGSGPNTKQLYLNGWKGLEMDGSHENLTMNLRKEFITRENVASLFQKYDVPKEPDYVSIDIDSCDLWVFLGIVESEFRPRVFTVEYNAYWPLEKSVTNVCKTPDGELYRWHGDNMYGASLSALSKAANENGYSVVYMSKGLDAFMVRKDLLCPGTEMPIETFAAATGLTARFRKHAATPELVKWMQEY